LKWDDVQFIEIFRKSNEILSDEKWVSTEKLSSHRQIALSIETLVWAQQLDAISPAALEFVRHVLPLPGENLLNSRFAEDRTVISATLQGAEPVRELIVFWGKGLPKDVDDRSIVLAVDAIAFRPLVTVTEDGVVHGLKHLRHLDDEDLLTHFHSDPAVFPSCYSTIGRKLIPACSFLRPNPFILRYRRPSFALTQLKMERKRRSRLPRHRMCRRFSRPDSVSGSSVLPLMGILPLTVFRINLWRNGELLWGITTHHFRSFLIGI
jgi:hypothetical protein